ncbi:hypothetical protein [Rahnella phage Sarma103]|nr:hypothetical protein [Rahnella phage Sarma103]
MKIIFVIMTISIIYNIMQAMARISLKAELKDASQRLANLDAELNLKVRRINDMGQTNRNLEHILQMERRDYAEHTDNRKGLIAELRAESKKLQTELDNRKKLAGIKFTADVPELGLTRTEFKLGLGSCGLVVEALGWKEEDDRYILTQWCDTGERKEFTYFKKDIAGRIEIQYNSLKGNTL